MICYVTPKGLALLKRLETAVSAAQETGGLGLKLSETRALISMLARVRATAREAARK